MERITEARRTPRVLVINKIDKLTNEQIEAKKKEVRGKTWKI